MSQLPGVKSALHLCNYQETKATLVCPLDEQKVVISGHERSHEGRKSANALGPRQEQPRPLGLGASSSRASRQAGDTE